MNRYRPKGSSAIVTFAIYERSIGAPKTEKGAVRVGKGIGHLAQAGLSTGSPPAVDNPVNVLLREGGPLTSRELDQPLTLSSDC
jgi:hypothetical protein